MSLVLNEIKELRNLIQAGKSTLSGDELSQVFGKINEIVSQFEKSQNTVDEAILQETIGLFDGIVEGDFAAEFMSSCPDDNFYFFGSFKSFLPIGPSLLTHLPVIGFNILSSGQFLDILIYSL